MAAAAGGLADAVDADRSVIADGAAPLRARGVA
jgi:hypothetical protein